MKRLRRWFIYVCFIMFSPNLLAQAIDSVWDGEYFYEGVYGNTYGGSPIIVDYTVRIFDGVCEIQVAGFQEYDEILCYKDTSRNSITLLFDGYSSGNKKNTHGVEVYHSKQPLLKFVRVSKSGKTKLITYWLGITDPYNKLPKPGMYFKYINTK